jgi:Branched-chain amino acid ABC-type transport system, permease components
LAIDPVQIVTVALNGLTQAALYFIVASGFTLIFGLMRTVNMAHGSLYLFGAYLGYSIGKMVGGTGEGWLLAIVAAVLGTALVGLLMQRFLLGWMPGQDLRQALVTIGLSIIIADLLLMQYGGITYQFSPPGVIAGGTALPFVLGGIYSTFRLFLLAAAAAIGIGLWLLLNRTKLGMIIRAGIDDRGMLSALGVDVPRVFLLVFVLGAGLAGLAGVMGGTALSISPGEDARYLLSSLVVVIVGGMGSLSGAAIGAVIVGMAEQFGLFYWPYYATLVTFAIMAGVLAIRPQGLRGRPA